MFCSSLIGLLLITLIVSIYYVFEYRARYLNADGDSSYLRGLLNDSERELLELKSKCKELEYENDDLLASLNFEMERLNPVHQLKTQVIQADTKQAV